MILQDIYRGRGICLIDPHGDLVSRVHEAIPEHRKKDVIYLNAPNSQMPFRYNPLSKVNEEARPLIASGLIEILKRLWDSAWGVRLEHILRHILLTLLDQPSATFADILRILREKDFRESCMEYVQNNPDASG